MGENAYREATELLACRRRHAEEDADRRREELYQSLPQLRQFDAQTAEVCRRMTAAALEGEPTEQYRLALEQLKRDRLHTLSEIGMTEEQLRPQYSCPLCGDTGFVDGKRCRCLQELLREKSVLTLPAGLLAGCRGFMDFDLTYYSDAAEGGNRSPQETMKNILAYCRRYAENFGKSSGNLLFTGRTGLGKTYLSACIARAVAEKGFTVRYYPAQALIDCFERVRFNRNATPDDMTAMREILSCDLLILDDMGAEFATAYSQSVLYQVINDRMTECRPTIISTNLDLPAMGKMYNERILSRLIGSYTMFRFVGKDIRQQKLARARGEAAV